MDNRLTSETAYFVLAGRAYIRPAYWGFAELGLILGLEIRGRSDPAHSYPVIVG
ncbi:23126_t:CDS:2 [Dentiscutata erythropus]|uniref:23126_t:CDS:1 n=1 Tax=Dentiscutata erythropus TaxID=1348616 RepID=A0A9N8YUX0_9GLOM|nr:23126_t:CDS:2 [Dentiscutata erythropus]